MEHVLILFIFAIPMQICFFLDFFPLTNVRIRRFLNFENHVFLDQIQLVTPSMKMVLKDKWFGVKIANIQALL